MTVQDTLIDMFHNLITVLPRTTAALYLQKIYPEMTPKAVTMALNRAIFDLQCNYDKEKDIISMYKGPEISKTRMEAMSRAFRVAVELMDSNQQIVHCSYPFEYQVINGDKVFEITYLYTGQESAVSHVVASKKVDEDERPFVRRIAVVDYGAEIDYIKRVGFSKIARVTDDNEVEILASIPQSEAWADMDDE